jgi:septum formation protein
MKKIVLASKSVDRKELLKRSKLDFEIMPTDINEEKLKNKIDDPNELVEQLAKLKAIAAKNKLEEKNQDALIIAADTIIEYKGEIIGKAMDKEKASQILHKLSGKTHNLITGIAITETHNQKIVVVHDTTKVKFMDLSDHEIRNYIKSEEWRGRAGAYSIRDKASLFIESIQGSPSNVIGLPMNKLFILLKKEFNVNLL